MPNFLTHADWTFRYRSDTAREDFEIGEFCSQNNIANPLIVTDRGSRDLPFIERVGDVCLASKVQSVVFSDISPNPTDQKLLVENVRL